MGDPDESCYAQLHRDVSLHAKPNKWDTMLCEYVQSWREHLERHDDLLAWQLLRCQSEFWLSDRRQQFRGVTNTRCRDLGKPMRYGQRCFQHITCNNGERDTGRHEK